MRKVWSPRWAIEATWTGVGKLISLLTLGIWPMIIWSIYLAQAMFALVVQAVMWAYQGIATLARRVAA